MTFYVDNLAYYGAVSYVLTFVGDGTVVKSGTASAGAESVSVTLTTTERNTLGTDAVYAQMAFSSGGNDYSSNIIKLSQEELFDDRIVRTSFTIEYDIEQLALQNKKYTASRSIYVNGSSGSDVTGDGTSSKPYKTIQKAINSASPTESLSYPFYNNIYVAGGTYTENLRVAKRIRIYLQGNVTITAKDNANSVISVERDGLLYIAKSSSLETAPNLTLSGGNYSINCYGYCSISSIGTFTLTKMTGQYGIACGVEGCVNLNLSTSKIVVTATSVNASNTSFSFLYANVDGCIIFTHSTSDDYTFTESFASHITTKTFAYATTCGRIRVYNAKISSAWTRAYYAYEGGVIAVRGGTSSAGTQYSTNYGGRIYSGAQASVPSY